MAFLRNLAFKTLSAVNYFFRTVSVYHHPGKQVVLPSQTLPFSGEEKAFLEACAASFNYEIDYAGGYRQKEVAVTRLQNVTFLGNSGALVLNEKLISESVFDLRRVALSPAWRMPAFILPKTKQGVYTSIMHLPWAAGSNYHWFFDCLPRVFALVQTVHEPVTFIMNQNAPAFQQETLAFILKEYPNFRVEFIGKTEKWHCPEFIFPSFVAGHVSGFLPEPISSFLRAKIFRGYQINQTKPFRKIFISRSKATKRRILNEAALLPILQETGFEIVFPEELSYREQVKLFAESKVVVGAHGAGFTNLLFCQNTSVLELHPATALKPHYFLLSKGQQLNYHYLVGSAANEKLDFEVEEAAFEQKISAILEK